MKAFYLFTVFTLVSLIYKPANAANRYWVAAPVYYNNFNLTTDLSQWLLTGDNGTGSWSVTTYGTAILRMDNAAGGFANRLFNVSGGVANLIPLDKVNGVVSFQVIALSGGNQRFYLQVEEYNAANTLLGTKTILAPTATAGSYSVNMSSVAWNVATTRVRFILGGSNQSAQQGTIELNYFIYTNSTNNWNDIANWSASSGGAGGASVPGASDLARFDGASGFHAPCLLTGAVTVGGISMAGYTGTLDLRGFNLSSTGTNTFNTGNVASTNAAGSLIFNTTGSTTFAGTSFHAIVSGSSGNLFFNGSYFNNAVNLTKTGASTNTGTGGNTFQDAVTLSNIGNSSLRMANLFPDIFNSSLSLVVGNVGTDPPGEIDMSYTATGSEFNGDVTISYSKDGAITFGGSGGTSSLGDGNTITIGSCTGDCGTLSLAGVETGTTAQSIVFPTAGTGSFRTALAAVWNGNLTVTAASILLDGATFNGTTTITKTGSLLDESNGGNAFNGTTTIANTGTGTLRMATGTGDAFNGDVTFSRFGGVIEPAYNGSNSFTADITTNSSSSITFGAGSGTVTFTDVNAQTLTRVSSTAGPVIRRLLMSKSGSNRLTLSTPLTIGISANFIAGIIDVTAGNYISFDNSATASNAKNSSHVDGVVKKTGNSDFVFPIGDGGVYRPLTITSLSLASTFAAQFFRTPQLLGSAKDGALSTVSDCEYWTLDRESGLGIPYVTLSWQSNQCNASAYVTDPVDLRVAHWNGAFWEDYGSSGYTGTAASGSVTTSLQVNSFSPFALASATPDNPLPVTLDNFRGIATDGAVALFWETATELNNDYFTVLRSANGKDFEELGMLPGAGTTSQRQYYTFRDKQPLAGTNYYRLRQTDFDQQVRYSDIIAVNPDAVTAEDDFYLYPNPADRQWVTFSQRTGFSVMNAVGQQVLGGATAAGFDASVLPAGLYWVVIGSGRAAKLIIR